MSGIWLGVRIFWQIVLAWSGPERAVFDRCVVSFRRADQQPAEYAVEIYSSVAKSTIFKSKILNKEIFWDVIILTFCI